LRPRTKSEKVLLAILIGIIFVGGNFYGYQWLASKQASLDLTRAQLRADQAEAEVDLQKADVWAKRKAWIQAQEPVLGEEGDTKAKVLEYVLKGARDHHLEILEQTLNDSQPGVAGTRINVSIKIKGGMEGLCQWLSELQKPERFYAISLLSLKADQDQKSMVATLQLFRYFKGGS
jgi:hypothetical protein